MATLPVHRIQSLLSKEQELTMQKRQTAWFIYLMLVLASAGAMLLSAERPAGTFQQAGFSMRAPTVSDTTIAAGALGDFRYLDVPP
jgi:hypothetical protein